MKSCKNVDEGKSQPITVYVRLRPFHENEKPARALEIRSRDILVNLNHKKKYSFDGVFGPDSKQVSLYKIIAKPLISEIVSGYNCTVFAYGQTGTGKTYTMTGGLPNFNPSDLSSNNSTSSVNSDFHDSSFSSDNGSILGEASGLIPRVVEKLFNKLKSFKQQYTVQCSYLEIYNEDLRDLLSDGDGVTSMKIFEGQRNKGAVIIQGIAEITVHNKQDLFKLLQKGLHKRQTASTNMNDRSSRSHAVFSIIVHTREAAEDGEILVKTGKLNLVDLAGSENIGRSGSLERRAREAGNINQSLLTLGRVIKALAENNSHIPFRESKLTRILQDSLGGRTKTVIIATISPCALSIDETLSTLDYAFKARVITNKPEVNQRISQKALITQYVDEIRRLKGDIKAAQTGEGIRMDRDNYNNLVTNVQISIDKVTHSALHIQNLEKELKLLQEEKEQREREYEALNKSFEETHIELEKEREMCAKIELEKRTQEYLANRYEKNAQNLYEEAKSLLDIVKSTSFNEALLRKKVEHLYNINNFNRDLIQMKSEDIEKLCSASLHDLTSHSTVFSDHYDRILEVINNASDWQEKVYHEVTDLLSFIYSNLQTQCDNHTVTVEKACSDFQQLKTKNAAQLSSVVNSLTTILDTGNLQFHTAMKDLLLTESKRHINFCANISNRMSELNSLIQSSVEELSVDLDTLKYDILNELKLLSEGIRTKINANKDGYSQTVDLRNNLLKAIYLGFEAIENDAGKGKECDGYNMTRSENVQNKFAIHTDTILNKLENYSAKTSTICDKEYTEFPDPNSAIEKFESTIEDHVIYFNGQNTQSVKNFKDNGAEIRKYCEEVCGEHSSRLEDIERDMHANIDKIKERISEKTTKMHDDSVAVGEDIMTVFHAIDNYSQERHKFEMNMINNVQQLNLLLNSTDKDIVDVVPTGDTPIRNNREYPNHLKELTPKDKVLSKFLLFESECDQT